MFDLRKWLTDNVLSYSSEEIVDPVKMSSVQCRRKIMLVPSRRGKHKGDRGGHDHLVCKSFYELEPGVFEPRANMGKAGTMVWKTKDPRAREEPTSRACIRHWKMWRGERIVTASFFRVGVMSGAHMMAPGGEVRTICQPPLEGPPLATVDVLRPNGGFLHRVSVPNPERAVWDEWATMIDAVRAFVDNEVSENKIVPPSVGVYGSSHESCSCCLRHVSTTDAPWRIVHGWRFCPVCYRKLGTTVE